MITKSKFYPAVYLINTADDFSENQMENLLMCGDSNWDYYFYALVDESKNIEKIENVELVEFESEKDMNQLLAEISLTKLLDYSTVHEKPCVLKLV